MAFRPPLRLWRYLLAEQWKLLLITTSVVVVVIAFAATVKPLSEGKLDALDVPKFILLAVPPMLAYALPFAACFSATMTYHRLGQDNETVGIYAAGISHRAVLFPTFLTGLILCVALLGLNDRVIPRFLREMQRLVTRDVVRMIARAVESGESVRLGDWVIAADKAFVVPQPPEGVTAQARLTHVAAMKLGKPPADAPPGALNIESLGVADFTDLWLLAQQADDQDSIALIELSRAVGRFEGQVSIAFAETITRAIPVPNAFHNDPEFLTSTELLELRTAPERLDAITYYKRVLAAHLAAPLTIEALADDLRSTGRCKLIGPPASGQTIYIFGADLRPVPEGFAVVAPPGGQVEIEEYRNTPQPDPEAPPVREVVRWTVNRAFLDSSMGDPGRPDVSLTLRVRRAESASTEGISGERLELRFANLRLEQDLTSSLAALSIDDLTDRAQQRIDADLPGAQRLVFPRGGLINRWQRLQREIIAKINERIALALSCIAMILIGAIAALRLRHAPPLLVYLVSFLPALLTLIMINGGQQFTHRSNMSGLFLLWGGVALPALGASIGYLRLRRH